MLINYFHTLMIAKSFDLNWPSQLEDALDSFSFVGEVNDNIFSLECFLKDRLDNTGSSPIVYRKLLITAAYPIFCLLFVFLVWRYLCRCLVKRERRQMRRDTRLFNQSLRMRVKTKRPSEPLVRYEVNVNLPEEDIRHRNMAASLIILYYLMYPMMAMKTFTVLSCIEIEEGEYWMREDIDLRCWDSAHHGWVFKVAVPCIALWIIGPLIFLGVFMKRNSRRLKKPNMLLYVSFFTNGLKPQYYYWDLLLNVRKLGFILINVYVTSSTFLYKVYERSEFLGCRWLLSDSDIQRAQHVTETLRERGAKHA